MKFIFILYSFLVFSFSSRIWAYTFSFDQDVSSWENWGDGRSAFDPFEGNNNKGCLWISTDFGETQTVHHRWDKLRPGLYKVTAYVRAKDVQPNNDKASFIHFYDGGEGIKEIFTDLKGSYGWRRLEYTLKVKKSDLTLWFRLKSPGQVWIDDVTLVPTEGPNGQIELDEGAAFVETKRTESARNQNIESAVLVDFDRSNLSHPFTSTIVRDNSRMGQLTSQKYYNFEPQNYLQGNWTNFDRIEFDVFNGSRDFVEIYVTIGDHLSRNYWSQLNHKTHLSSGWNHLSFSLTQFLGERGSHRFHRGLDLSKLKKFFLIADPNSKFPVSSNFYVDNIKLTSNPAPQVPEGVFAFDFTSHKDSEVSGMKKVTSQDLYSKEKGLGFVSPEFWRIEDAQWAPNSLRYTIGLLEGEFKVKLPNGSYRGKLVVDRLGYWDPSFWKERSVYVNGKSVLQQTRKNGNAYLQDWLRFEDTVPTSEQNPFELYLSKIFKPIEFSFIVKNGELTLQFQGDPTGISLNSLIIWNSGSEENAKRYLASYQNRLRNEFNWMTRTIDSTSAVSQKIDHVAVPIEASLTLRASESSLPTTRILKLTGGQKEKPYQFFQLRGEEVVDWKISDLRTKTGKVVPGKSFEFSELVPQYISPDLNHETYLVAGKYLKTLAQDKISVRKGESTYVMLRLSIDASVEPGNYEGSITFSSSGKSSTYPIQLSVLAYELPSVEFPVGFFGPDPISQNYFEDDELEKTRLSFRQEALKSLGEAGFTTFTGLPGAKLITEDRSWSLDTSSADAVMSAANRAGMSKIYFTYGGKFPQQFFDGSLLPPGIEEKEFLANTAPLVAKYLGQTGMPKIVYTFSDEAGGYSDRVTEDVELGKKIKKAFPFLLRGGFGSKSDKASAALRTYFDYGFFSNVTKREANENTKIKWGSYNAAPGNLDDPRFTFGPGLYFSRSKGLSQYLEWHASSVNNFPYYDLDGRESDVTMFMPSTNGKIHPTLRFILAQEGLAWYRKLKLIEAAVSSERGTPEKRRQAMLWLRSLSNGDFSSAENILKAGSNFKQTDFQARLEDYLNSFYK